MVYISRTHALLSEKEENGRPVLKCTTLLLTNWAIKSVSLLVSFKLCISTYFNSIWDISSSWQNMKNVIYHFTSSHLRNDLEQCAMCIRPRFESLRLPKLKNLSTSDALEKWASFCMLHLHPQITVMFLACHLQPFSVVTCHRMIAIHLGFFSTQFPVVS